MHRLKNRMPKIWMMFLGRIVGARAESLGQVARVGERGRAGVTDLSRSASSVRMTTNRDPNTKMAR